MDASLALGAETVIEDLRAADAQGDAEAAVRLGQAFQKQGDVALARAAFERGEARGHREAAMCLGNMLWDAGDNAGAKLAFERGVDAGSAIALLNLGLLLAQEGQVESALRYLRIARANGDSEAHWPIGRLLETQGDLSGAREAYTAGMEAGDANAAYGLGFVLYKTGDQSGATAAFTRSADLGHEGAPDILATLEAEKASLAQAIGQPEKLVHELATACAEAQQRWSACAERSLLVQKAQHVAAQPQAPASRDNFLRAADRYLQDFLVDLSALRNAQARANDLWNRFLVASDAAELSMDKVLLPLFQADVIQIDELNSIMIGGLFVRIDCGTTMESFFDADDRLAGAMK